MAVTQDSLPAAVMPRPRPFRVSDQRDAESLFVRTWSRMGSAIDSLLSPGGMFAVIVAAVVVSRNLSSGLKSASGRGGTLLVPLFGPPLGALAVLAFFALRNRTANWDFINHTMGNGFRKLRAPDAENHCFDHGQRHCWVVDATGKSAAASLIGLVVLKTCTGRPQALQSLPTSGREIAVTGSDDIGYQATIDWLVVDPTMRRCGVASALLRDAEIFCASIQDCHGEPCYHHLRLVVSNTQREAMAFYLKCGYEVESSTTVNRFGEKEFWLSKTLHS